jgi:hypothetical protein
MPLRPVSRRLVRCLGCGADFVVPTLWREHGDGQWAIQLRCGACGARRNVTASDEEADRLRRDVVAGLLQVEATLHEIQRESMVAAAALFSEAFARDLIDAADFDR